MATPKEFVWSKESYSIRELLNKFGTKFPIIVQVTGGYCGQDEIETLSSGQVARIHEQGEQRRVLAMDTKGRYLSIPGDYPIKFEVVRNGKKSHRGRTLLDIVRDNKLPVTVQIEHRRTWLFDVGAVKYKSSDFGILELLGTYKQHFLKVNTIHEGVIDGKVTFVPLYVDVDLRVAQGVKNATDAQWTELADMYDRAVAHIDFKKTKGNTSIMLYPAKVSDPDWEAPTATARIPSNDSTSGYSSSVMGQSFNGRMGSGQLDGRISQQTDNSASIVRMLPNMTLVMNLNKDELTNSLGRPTPSPRLESPFRPSNISDTITESDRKSLRSDGDTDDTSSTLTESDSSTKLQNVVRLKLGSSEQRRSARRSRSRSRSKSPPRVTSPTNSVRPSRVEAVGAPVAIFDDREGKYNVTFPIRRSVSLESMQDAYQSDAETTSSSMGIVPRYLKAKSTNYGMRFLKKSDRNKVFSHSNPDLSAGVGNTLQIPTEQPNGAMTTGRIPNRKAVSFSNADRSNSFKEIYQRDNLQITVHDLDEEEDQSNMMTYTRRPGMERASKVAFRSVSRSTSPASRSVSPARSVSPYNSLPRARPFAKPVPSTQVNYRSATLPSARRPPAYGDALSGRGVTPVTQNKEFRTAPLKSSAALPHRSLSNVDQNWQLRGKYNTNTMNSDSTASVTSETDSDIIYQGTLTLKRQQNGSFQAQRSMYQMLATQGGNTSNYGTLNSSRNSTPTPGQDYDPMHWADQEWRRLRHQDPGSQIQNIPIEYDSDVWMPPMRPNGNVTLTNSSHGYDQQAQNGWSSATSSLDRNMVTKRDDGVMKVQEIKSNDGTVIRHEVVQENAINSANSAGMSTNSAGMSANSAGNANGFSNAGGSGSANGYSSAQAVSSGHGMSNEHTISSSHAISGSHGMSSGQGMSSGHAISSSNGSSSAHAISEGHAISSNGFSSSYGISSGHGTSSGHAANINGYGTSHGISSTHEFSRTTGFSGGTGYSATDSTGKSFSRENSVEAKFGMRYAPADISSDVRQQNGYREVRRAETEIQNSSSMPPLITVTRENEENVPPANRKQTENVPPANRKQTENVPPANRKQTENVPPANRKQTEKIETQQNVTSQQNGMIETKTETKIETKTVTKTQTQTEDKKSAKKEKSRTDSVNSLRDAMNKYGSMDGAPKMSVAESSETFTEAANRTIERYKKKKAKTTKPVANGHASGDEIEKIKDSIRDLDDYLQTVDTVDTEDDQRHYTTF